jgi:hypothetical protein
MALVPTMHRDQERASECVEMSWWLARGPFAACVLLVIAHAMLNLSCKSTESNCGTCSRDSDCESGFCFDFDFGGRCVDNHPGSHTECCVGDSCSIYYGSNISGHGCVGSPYATCADCLTDLNGCGSCFGCTSAVGSPGTCSGTPTLTDCQTCGIGKNAMGQLRQCSWCPGCTTGAETCSGTPSCASVSDQSRCAIYGCTSSTLQKRCESLGCTWSTVALQCTGTATVLCSSLADPVSCAPTEGGGCMWSDCSGTFNGSCDQLSSSQVDCERLDGCTWKAPTKACVGTPTPCAELNSSTCESQYGCRSQ